MINLELLERPDLLLPGLLAFITMFSLWMTNRGERAYVCWSLGFLLITVAAAVLPANLDSVGAILLAAVPGYSALGLLYAGLLAYRGHGRHILWVTALILAVGMVASIAVVPINPNAGLKMFSIGVLLIWGAMALTLYQGNWIERITAVVIAIRAVNGIWMAQLIDGYSTLDLVRINHLLHLAVAMLLLAAALERSRQQVQSTNKVLSLFHVMMDRLGNISDAGALRQAAGDVLTDCFNSISTTIYRYDEPARELVLVYDYGLPEDAAGLMRRLPIEGSIVGRVLSSGRAESYAKMHDRDSVSLHKLRGPFRDIGIEGGIAVPISSGVQWYGAFMLGFREETPLSARELSAFESIGDAIGLVASNVARRNELEHLAHHDALTQLPNRSALEETLNDWQATGSMRAALLLLDLDRFREINDTLGHHIGDELLRHTAWRLTTLLQDRDARVFRLGGDDFAIALFNLDDLSEASACADVILDELHHPAEIGDMSLSVDGAIGIALAPLHGTDSRELLRCAEVAMYHAKHSDATITVYGSELDPHTRERLQLMSDLRQALTGQQLELHYQPKIDLASGHTSGVEALIRWRHPTIGFVAPGRFIPMAEVSPIINQITTWVANTAIRQIQAWEACGLDLSVAINISARNLTQHGWCEDLIDRVHQSGIDPQRLELEITETVLMQDPETARQTLERLAATGMRIAIDDFGTGYSSLAYLQRLPIHTLKIDRAFITHLDSDAQSRRIVETVLSLARGLNLHTVAEGIETEASGQILQQLGCNAAQGYFYGRPMPIDAFNEWLQNWPANAANPYIHQHGPDATRH